MKFLVAFLAVLIGYCVDAWLVMLFLHVIHRDAAGVPALGYTASLAAVFIVGALRKPATTVLK